MDLICRFRGSRLCPALFALFGLALSGAAFGASLATVPVQAGATPAAQIDIGPVSAGNRDSALPEGWQHGAFSEIFVRGYRDSDGDGIGDLRGLTASLDYLHDLGVRGIWLMPITRSLDHDHGYAVTDYRDIEPAYGTLADFDELLRQAHARGIGVIIDYVINHSAATHPIFLDAAARRDSVYRDWYLWREPAPRGWRIYGRDPWVVTGTGAYLAQFSPTMPDFNLLNARVLAFHEDNLRFWLNRGVDGFRFDAAAHLVENGPDAWYDQPQNYVLLNRLRAVVAGYAHRYLVCEAVHSIVAYAAPTACGGAFLFGGGSAIVKAARGERDGIAAVAGFFRDQPATLATMVSNHDLFAGERLWDQVHGDRAQYRLAAASYLLLPGTPFIYYGEEIGMSASPGLEGDVKLRTPMSWTDDRRNAGFTSGTPYRPVAANIARQNVATERSEPDSLLAWYTSLLRLRNAHASLARGSYERSFVDGNVMGFRRRLGDETTLVLINYGKKPAQVSLRDLPASAHLRQVFPSDDGAALTITDKGSTPVAVGAQSLRVFTLTK